MCYNQEGSIQSLDGKDIKMVEDFTYLGSNIQSTDKDIQIRKAKAWAALNKLDKIWKSELNINMKRNFFKAVVESVLPHGRLRRNRKQGSMAAIPECLEQH